MVIVYIIVLIVGLSVLVCLHELGHLLVAKSCKVYCYEYSIGFGPAIVKHRFLHRTKAEKKAYKNATPLFRALTKGLDGTYGETQYALRWIPLGGYVAMAGEDDEPEDAPVVRVPKERTLTGVNHFKQIAIMLAGIAMNFLVAYILFFVAYSCFEQTFIDYTTNAVTVKAEDNPFYEAGLRTGDKILTLYQDYKNLVTADGENVEELVYPAKEDQVPLTSYLAYKEGTEGTGVDSLSPSSINYALVNVTAPENGMTFDVGGTEKALLAGENSTRTIHLTYENASGEEKAATVALDSVYDEEKKAYAFESFALDPYSEQHMLTLGQAFETSNAQFSRMFVAIYTALGEIFTRDGWKNVGGIVSVYRVSTQAVQSGSGTSFFSLWAYISLNLGCFNLIPLPPLDGWNVLIALGETVTRRKFSAKFKNVAGTIGMALLIVLAVLLIIKDVLIPLP